MQDLLNISTLDSLCLTYDHSYGIMSKEEQEGIQRLLSGIYHHHVKPLVDRIEELEIELKKPTDPLENITSIIIRGKDLDGKEFKEIKEILDSEPGEIKNDIPEN